MANPIWKQLAKQLYSGPATTVTMMPAVALNKKVLLKSLRIYCTVAGTIKIFIYNAAGSGETIVFQGDSEAAGWSFDALAFTSKAGTRVTAGLPNAGNKNILMITGDRIDLTTSGAGVTEWMISGIEEDTP